MIEFFVFKASIFKMNRNIDNFALNSFNSNLQIEFLFSKYIFKKN